jgi:hypothetical protein
MFPGNGHSQDQLRLASVLFLFTLGFLIISWFPENTRLMRNLENCSLLIGAFFFRALLLSDMSEIIPIWTQLFFVISFGLFLYFKLMRYFNRNKERET